MDHYLQQNFLCIQLKVTADTEYETSYFNPQLSVWEPLLEPLVLRNETLKPWCLHAEVTIATHYLFTCHINHR